MIELITADALLYILLCICIFGGGIMGYVYGIRDANQAPHEKTWVRLDEGMTIRGPGHD